MSAHWKLITTALFVVAAWLALVPTSATEVNGYVSPDNGGGVNTTVHNCGVPLLNLSDEWADGPCHGANGVRAQQALLTALFGALIVILGGVNRLVEERDFEREERLERARANVRYGRQREALEIEPEA